MRARVAAAALLGAGVVLLGTPRPAAPRGLFGPAALGEVGGVSGGCNGLVEGSRFGIRLDVSTSVSYASGRFVERFSNFGRSESVFRQPGAL